MRFASHDLCDGPYCNVKRDAGSFPVGWIGAEGRLFHDLECLSSWRQKEGL